MKCESCRYWNDNVSWRVSDEPTVRRCNKIKMFWDSTDWDGEGDKRIFKDDSLAFVQDGSDYHAELLTKADFYCNMWEQK